MLQVGTAKCGWTKLLSTNDSSSSFATRSPTATRPTANIIEKPGQIAENLIQIKFFGAGSNDNTLSARVYGWNVTNKGPSSTAIWMPTPLGEFTLTLSTQVGVAGLDVVATDRICDTIVGASWNPSGGIEVVSPTGNIAAHVVLDVKGAEIVQIDFNTGGSATNGNALVRWL